MGRSLLALVVLGVALARGDLLHPSPLYSLWLPLLGLAAALYLLIRLLRRSGRGGDGGAASGDGCGWDGGGDCGGDGGGD